MFIFLLNIMDFNIYKYFIKHIKIPYICIKGELNFNIKIRINFHHILNLINIK